MVLVPNAAVAAMTDPAASLLIFDIVVFLN
jgi:hypothetical protein